MEFLRECAASLDAGAEANEVLERMRERYTTAQCVNAKTYLVRKMCAPSETYLRAFDALYESTEEAGRDALVCLAVGAKVHALSMCALGVLARSDGLVRAFVERGYVGGGTRGEQREGPTLNIEQGETDRTITTPTSLISTINASTTSPSLISTINASTTSPSLIPSLSSSLKSLPPRWPANVRALRPTRAQLAECKRLERRRVLEKNRRGVRVDGRLLLAEARAVVASAATRAGTREEGGRREEEIESKQIGEEAEEVKVDIGDSSSSSYPLCNIPVPPSFSSLIFSLLLTTGRRTCEVLNGQSSFEAAGPYAV